MNFYKSFTEKLPFIKILFIIFALGMTSGAPIVLTGSVIKAMIGGV